MRRALILFAFIGCGGDREVLEATITIDPIRVLGDGRASASVIVTVTDAGGESVAGLPVQLAASVAGVRLVAANGCRQLIRSQSIRLACHYRPRSSSNELAIA